MLKRTIESTNKHTLSCCVTIGAVIGERVGLTLFCVKEIVNRCVINNK